MSTFVLALSRTYGDLFDLPAGTAIGEPSRLHGARAHFGGRLPITSDTRVRIADTFFIAEPQVSALWTIGSWM